MKLLNIRQNDGDKKGLHIFRHHFVAKLLQNEIPQPVITATTGHILPSSIEPYLSTDFKHLKEMALSIQKFPVSEDIFNDD
jgi:hypothetical protein